MSFSRTLMLMVWTLIGFTSQAKSQEALTINPADAVSEAIQVAVRASLQDRVSMPKLSSASASVGKYRDGDFGDYHVALNFRNASGSGHAKCQVSLTIYRDFLKMRLDEFVLQQSADQQIVAKVLNLKCN